MEREEFIRIIRECVKRAEMEPWCYISDDRYEEATIYVDELGCFFVCSKQTVYNVNDVAEIKYRGTIIGLEQGELCNYIKIIFKNGDILKLSFWDEVELMVKVEGGYNTYWYVKALEYFEKQNAEKEKRECSIVQNETERFVDFYDAHHYVSSHPANSLDRKERDLYEPENCFLQCLDMWVVKVNPESTDENGNCTAEHDIDKIHLNTKTEVWLEYGEVRLNEKEEIEYVHDLELDCGGDTYEEAIIKLANLMRKNPRYRNMSGNQERDMI